LLRLAVVFRKIASGDDRTESRLFATPGTTHDTHFNFFLKSVGVMSIGKLSDVAADAITEL
jgi:hypothetical protein